MGYFEYSKINIVKHSSIFLSVTVLIVVSAVLLFFTKGLNWGIDFTGGTLIEYKLAKSFDSVGEIRPILKELNIEFSFIL